MEKNSKKSIQELVEDWSRTFGLPMQEEKEFPSQERVALSLKLIDEELQETKDAILNKDFKETEDGLGDLLWVTIRAMFEMGIDPQKTIEAIYESNMSKADSTLDDAILTYKHYLQQGINTYSKEVRGKFITYRSSDNKVLKSHKFKAPELC